MTNCPFWFVVSFLIITPCVSEDALRILAIGDSITAGGGPPSGSRDDASTYRHDLAKILRSNGISAEFVGGVCHKCNLTGGHWDERCDMGCKRGADEDKFIAFWGWQAYQILDGSGPSWSRMDQHEGQGLKNMVSELDFDVAIIHLGTNDIGHRRSSHEIAESIFHIVEILRERNPSCKVLVSQIIPISSRWNTNNAVDTFNKYLQNEATKWNSTKSPLYIVDCHAGFDVDKHTVDEVHPNQAGAELMARRIYEVLKPLLVPLESQPPSQPSFHRNKTHVPPPTHNEPGGSTRQRKRKSRPARTGNKGGSD